MGARSFPEILPLYKEQFPNIDLQLIEGNSSELDAGLLHGEIDLIIGMLPFKVENIETVPLCDEEILLAVPNKVLEHAYPGQVEKIKEQLLTNADLRLLQNCPFLLINPGNRVPHSGRSDVRGGAGFAPKIILETENIETVLALAAKGMGITFYPKMFISSHEVFQNNLENKTGLNFYSLNYPKAHGVLGIGYHKGHYMSQATKEFIRIAKETL